uniref:Uncharacterized protein n=1 Tax=Hemiselmis andersenii TaxID=464988 RepID=A0A6T8JF43_HEMAN
MASLKSVRIWCRARVLHEVFQGPMFELAARTQALYFYPGYDHDEDKGLFMNNATCGMGKNSDVGQDSRCSPERHVPVASSHPAITCYGPCSNMPSYRPWAWGQGDT